MEDKPNLFQEKTTSIFWKMEDDPDISENGR